jgi:hypothetical protein
VTDRDAAHVLAGLPVSRIAHFTPAINAFSILRSGWIRSRGDLEREGLDDHTPTDLERWDGHRDHISCTFEYPNAYYRRTAAGKPEYRNYPDWVTFLIEPAHAGRADALFSPCNAATAKGAYIASGGDALAQLWSEPSIPAGRRRKPRQHPAVPTDLQAEVLVRGPIPLSDVQAIVVNTPDYASELYASFNEMGLGPGRLTWKVAPLFHAPEALRDQLWYGRPVPETIWIPEGAA